MTTQQFEQAAELIEKIKHHKEELEKTKSVIDNLKPETFSFHVNRKNAFGTNLGDIIDIPSSQILFILQTISDHHKFQMLKLEQQLEKI